MDERDERTRDERLPAAGDESTWSEPEAEKLDAARTYTVEPGDTLWSIAETYYGDGSEWSRIQAANRDRIDDPERVPPGVILRIPERTEAEGEG